MQENQYARFKIDEKDLNFLGKLGEGSFGLIKKVIYKNKKYAAKIIDYDSKLLQEMIDREIMILAYCSHPTIIDFIGYSILNNKKIAILMQLAEKGSLGDIIKSLNKSIPPENFKATQKQIILVGIAKAMMYLHNHNIVHRDLKPDNILLDKNYQPLLSDFGLSKFNKENTKNTKNEIGTLKYMAPEIHSNPLYYDPEKADVYSYAILAYEVITGTVAFGKITDITSFKFQVSDINNPLRPHLFDNEYGLLGKLLTECWSNNPLQRPTFEDIFNRISDINNDEYILDGVDENELKEYVDNINKNTSPNDIFIQKINVLKNRYNLMVKNLNINIFNLFPLDYKLFILSEQKNHYLLPLKDFTHCLFKFDQLKTCKCFKLLAPNDNTSLNDICSDYQIEIDFSTFKILINDDSFYQKLFTNCSINSFLIQVKYPENTIMQIIEKINNLKKNHIKINSYILICQIPDDVNLLKEIEVKWVKIDNKITKIDSDNGLFNGCNKLEQISIPSSIDKIGRCTFKNCELLQQITIPPLISEIEPNVFDGCKALTHITIPSSIEKIGSYSFNNCQSIKKISIPSTVKIIEKCAFQNCSNLEQIKIPEKIINIKEYTFNNCENLKQIFLPSSLKSIGDYSFSGCKLLQQLIIPHNVNDIGKHAFEGCQQLAQIIIPNGVKEIKEYAFNGCNELIQIVFPYELETIGQFAFAKCKLQEIFLPISLKTIEQNAFEECSLVKILVPQKITRIQNSVFKKSTKLKEVSISNSITKICDHAFEECNMLEIISIPLSVSEIGQYCFNLCSNLKVISIPESVTEIMNYAFSGCSSLHTIHISNSVLLIKPKAFCGCIALKEIKIPSKIVTIESYTFEGCTALNKIHIPESVNDIHDHAFSKCSSLKYIEFQNSPCSETFDENHQQIVNITIPSTIKTMGKYVFSECSSLDKIIIESSIETINEGTFQKCTSLKKITLSNSVRQIDNNAFNECTSLNKINIDNVKYIGNCAFRNCAFTEISINYYINFLGKQVFENCQYLKEFKYTYSIKSMGSNFFKNQTKKITINDLFFNGCKQLQIVNFPNDVTAIGERAFYGCENIKQINIPSTVASIGRKAFRKCKALVKIKIPDSVILIPKKAFSQCEALIEIDMPKVITIESRAFDKCIKLKKIKCSVTNVAEDAFSSCNSFKF